MVEKERSLLGLLRFTPGQQITRMPVGAGILRLLLRSSRDGRCRCSELITLSVRIGSALRFSVRGIHLKTTW